MSVKIMSRVWEESKQGGNQLLLLLAIADNANDEGYAWPGQEYLSKKIRLSKRTIPRLIKKLNKAGELFANDRSEIGKSTEYIVTTGMSWDDFAKSLQVNLGYTDEQCAGVYPWFHDKGGATDCQGCQIDGVDTAMSGGVDIAVSGGVDIAVSTEPSVIINEPSVKASSDNADYSRPISLLSEKEIKDITKGKHFKLDVWETWLTDERTERNRAGVLKFLDSKIGKFQLLPDTPAAHTLFEKLAVEYDAKGRRPPDSFPNLAIKQNFDKAVGDLNGRFDEAITKALEANITAIPRIVKYISSANWRKDTNGQQTSNVSSGGQTQGRSPQPGNGRTPEMQGRLEAAHAPKP